MGATDFFLLDTYSQTVSDVVERIGPSVAAVQVGEAGAAGRSGFAAAHRPPCARCTERLANHLRGEFDVLRGRDQHREPVPSPVEKCSVDDLAGVRFDDVIVGLDDVVIDSVDRLHQTLDASRIWRDCTLKLLRGTLSLQPLYLQVLPIERSAGV